jgi:DNA polymerase I-like protein with 3'-5' exonuclease and polymerase domains
MKHVLFLDKLTLTEFIDFVNSEFGNISIVSFDLETDSVNEETANIYGIGLAFEEDEGFYIPIRNKLGELYFDPQTTERIYVLINNLLGSKKIIGHNLVYDILVWYFSTGIDHTNSIYADTILMKHVVDEEQPFGLKETAVKYLGAWADKAQERLYENIKTNGGSITKTNLEMYKADTEVLGEYCAYDVMLTYKLFNKFSQTLEIEGTHKLFYEDEIMPLYREVTIPMKKRGVQIDTELYKTLSEKGTEFIKKTEKEVLDSISGDIKAFEDELLEKEFPVKKTGNFPKMYAKVVGLEIDSLSKKAIQSINPQSPEQTQFKTWLTSDIELNPNLTRVIQRQMYFTKYPEETAIFNVNSKQHLKWLFFSRYNEEPLSTTDKGAPQVDDTFLDSIKDRYPWIEKLRDLNTVQKMKSTYYDGILERINSDGILRASFLQFGTTSGRFASRNPNLQNCPAPQKTGTPMDEFVNGVRNGIVSRNGYKLIGSDFSSLEPRVASYVSGDKGLQQIFIDDVDFYSAIAIKQFKLSGVSADSNQPNYLGKVDKKKRALTKTYCFTEDTIVDLENKMSFISRVVVGDQIKTKKGYFKVTNTFTRKSETVTVITNKGILKCTPDHKIWSNTDNCWVEAAKLKINDILESNRDFRNYSENYLKLPFYSVSSIGKPNKNAFLELTFNEDWAWILGAFLGDGVGSWTNRKERAKRNINSHLISAYVGICGLSEDNVVNKWVDFFESFGYRSREIPPGKQKQSFKTFLISSTELTNLFQKTLNAFCIGNEGRGHKNLRIQPFVFNSNLRVRLAFLAGLFDTDGYLKHNKTKKYSDVAVCTKSLDFASDICKLLSDLGVDARLQIQYNKTYNKDYYTISLTRSGIFLLKQLGLSEFLQCPRKKEAIELATPPKIFKSKDTCRVLRITPGSTEDVYDITVESVHEFYANNIRVHNCLAVFYGADKYRISQVINDTPEKADELIQGYFSAFPGIKNFIEKTHYLAKTQGFVKTIFGRTRHLQELKNMYKMYGDKLLDSRWAKKHNLVEQRRVYKNLLNNSVNFQVQGTAGHAMNRAMLKTARLFKENGIDGYIVMTIHDEQIIEVREDQVDKAVELTKLAMETAVNLDPIKLKSEPIVGRSYGECK